jgi:hypothetical protein
MAEPEKWSWNDPKDGIGIVKMSSWQHFMEFVYSEMLDYETYIWRGQRNSSWKLETTLDRLIKAAKVRKTKQYDFVKNHLEQFKLATRGRRGANPRNIENENEWWALGQHHGLATPLLDWTLSPFVAAYFAFIETGQRQTKYRAVYALHKPTIEMKAVQIKRAKEQSIKKEISDIESGKNKLGLLGRALLEGPVDPEIEFIRPFSDENHRLVNQGGLFSKSPSGKNLETWVQENFSGEEEYNLMKILLPTTDRDQVLKTLNRMNINHLSLFPDLYGASKFCNLFGEIEQY